MTIDAIARKAASKTITKYGKTVQLIRVTPGEYDPSTATTTNTETSETIKAIVEEWKQTRRSSDGKFATGLTFLPNDKVITVAALDVVQPKPTDKFNVDGDIYTVPEMGVSITYSGELPVIFQIVGRKT